MMDGDTNAATTPVVVVPKPTETIWQEIEEFFVGAEKKTVEAIDVLEEEFDKDVWPYVKHFVGTLLSQAGQAALKAAVVAIPLLATGGFGAAAAEVGAAVASTVIADAPADAEAELKQAQAALAPVQAALQVVKVATATVTTGDAPTVAAIQAATAAAQPDPNASAK